MSRGGALALLLAAVVGCTEAPTLDPSRTADGTTGSGGAAGAPMMFVPYKPTGGAAGAANVGGVPAPGGSDGSSGGVTGMLGAGGGTTMGAAGGASGTPGPILATMLGLLPTAISWDGAVVAGTDEATGLHAMVWTPDKGARLLPPIKASHDRSEVSFVARSGTLYGFTTDSITGERQGVGWTSDTLVPFDTADPDSIGDCAFIPTAGSAIGFIAATCTHASGSKEAFAMFSGSPTPLGFLPGDTDSEAVLMSADSSTVAGYSYNRATKSQRAFRWTQAGGMTELPPTPGAFALPRAVSMDGSMIAYDSWQGMPTFPGVSHPTLQLGFVWMKDGANSLNGCPFSRVVAVSAKSSALLGACLLAPNTPPTNEVPFLSALPPALKLLAAPPAFLGVTPVGISASADLVVGLGHPPSGPSVVVLWRLGATAPTMMMASPTPSPAAPTTQPVDVSISALCDDGSTLVGAREDKDGSHHGWLIHP